MRNYERTIYHRGYKLVIEESFSAKGYPIFDLIVFKNELIVNRKAVPRSSYRYVSSDKSLKMFVDYCIAQDKKS